MQVQVLYPKKPRTYNLTPSRKKVGKAVGRGSKQSVIKECMRDPVMQKYTVEIVGQHVQRELAVICSEATNSVLRRQSYNALCGFSWAAVR